MISQQLLDRLQAAAGARIVNVIQVDQRSQHFPEEARPDRLYTIAWLQLERDGRAVDELVTVEG